MAALRAAGTERGSATPEAAAAPRGRTLILRSRYFAFREHDGTSGGSMEPLKQLGEHGQSVWFDFIRRDLVRDGGLADLVADGVRGVTSNPTIFDKAIGGSDAYDDALRALLALNAAATPTQLFEAVAIEDIQGACDVLRGVFDESQGHDGHVSLEVSPTLARDSEGTIRDARRLWAAVDRPNLMIKVPATPEGIPAIEELIAEGINVNATLMFSLHDYESVAQAYLRGLRRAAHPARIASVASFFVSRVDTAVDARLDEVGTDEAKRLRGTAAVANSKLAYRRYQELFESETFADLAAAGARPQRVLWASTSTKDPAYRDVLYVEELVGDNTVNTMPPQTVEAFRDHGIARPDAVTEGVAAAAASIAGLGALGIDFDAITQQLQDDGVAAFAASYQSMLDTIETKARLLLAAEVAPQTMSLGAHGPLVDARLSAWTSEGLVKRTWDKDHTVWIPEPRPEVTDRLGWLTLPETMREHVEDIRWFVDEVRADGITDVVLLGMGGSSLAPEVFARTFGVADGHPRLQVLDSTHPGAVTTVTASIDPTTTLFVVASKSGTTIEPLSFLAHFWEIAAAASDAPGRHFAAITDPGTGLAALGAERGYRKVFETIPDVGGRYSALTHFGLVPAALLGLDVGLLLDRAARMAAASRQVAADNPGFVLGAALGELAHEGRDKATFVTSEALSSLPDWLEQLIAESTGKEGTGILPIAGERLGAPESYGDDRVFVSITVADDAGGDVAALAALEAAGHPVIRIELSGTLEITAEMYRAQVAVAAAGSVLAIHPFDQPDVQRAKELAKEAMAGRLDGGAIDAVDARDLAALRAAVDGLLGSAEPADYVGFQAFIAPTSAASEMLDRARHAVRDRRTLATTVGFGPRFLHSTGQFHKGGPNTGLFIQIVDEPDDDVPVPGEDYTFGRLVRSQADGDHRALTGAGRRVLRVELGSDVRGGLENLVAALDG